MKNLVAQTPLGPPESRMEGIEGLRILRVCQKSLPRHVLVVPAFRTRDGIVLTRKKSYLLLDGQSL
jgi:hypothetical protein